MHYCRFWSSSGGPKKERDLSFLKRKDRSIDSKHFGRGAFELKKKKKKNVRLRRHQKSKSQYIIEQKYFHHHHSSFCWDKQRRRRRRFVILFHYYFEEEEGVVVVKTTTKTPTTQKQTNTHRIRVIKHSCVQFPSSSSQKILRAVRSTQVHAHLSLAP